MSEALAPRERAVGLEHDAVLAAQGLGIAALQEGAQLDLVDGGLALAVREQLLQMWDQEVADADGAGESLVLQLLERFPRVQALAVHRPVQEIQVDVLEPQPLEADLEGAPGSVVALVIVPQLGGDEDLIARHA